MVRSKWKQQEATTMGQLTINVKPELEHRLQQEAAKRGQAVEEYAGALLEATLAMPSGADAGSAGAGLPRRAPEELDAIATAQGAPLAARFEDLIGDFWPEGETCDEFIATLRQWRREDDRQQ